jgi:predicted nuclease of predicted toxin-antitoxin system
VLVFKDADFLARTLTLGPPPQFINVDLGNCATATLVNALRAAHPEIQLFVTEQSEAVLTLVR